jgi:chitinase
MRSILVIILSVVLFHSSAAQKKKKIAVIAYYAGRPTAVDSFPIEKITHIIFCFSHLRNDSMSIGSARDSAIIENMVKLKSRNPHLKVMLSLGGWGGCQYCSPVFADSLQRKTFAKTAKDLTDYFHTDGIDIDWEYPAVAGFPGHQYMKEDRANFTKLMRDLRSALGPDAEISFAAGGLKRCIDSGFEWKQVMKYADRVNLMSYDLVSGFDTISGHHTPLYSTPEQVASVDDGVKLLRKWGVPANKIAIGAAFYARIFANTKDGNKGLYQPTHFYRGVPWKRFDTTFTAAKGYQKYWDKVAQAPYLYNDSLKYLVTYDDSASIHLKTKYAMQKKLNGIMFWQLADDTYQHGLLDVIDETKKGLPAKNVNAHRRFDR